MYVGLSRDSHFLIMTRSSYALRCTSDSDLHGPLFMDPPRRRDLEIASSSYLLSFAAIVVTCRPWNRAAASSFSDGFRSPCVPAIVEAP